MHVQTHILSGWCVGNLAPLSPRERLICMTAASIADLDGLTRLRVPPGTQSGQRFRLRERGVPSPRDGRRGDLIVEARLVLPKILDERSKELLREFGRINAEDVRKELA